LRLDFAAYSSGTVSGRAGNTDRGFHPGRSMPGASGGAGLRIVRDRLPEYHLMKIETNSRPTTKKKPVGTASAPLPKPALSVSPGGKLGLIIDRLAAKGGATADELVAATGWQRHSVLGALSRLRSRGFAMHFNAHADRKAYRLDVITKPSAQSRAKG